MSLDYVNKGETVKASTINSIIDTLGGNQMMSPDLNVTTTARGPQVSMPSKFGGPNHRPYEIFELSRYMLSAWPMMMIQLGPKIEDCLGAIRFHKSDGTTATSLSSAVVFKNSENCPTGADLSSYMLAADDFGQDAAAHAAGWVQTQIEDISQGKALYAQLWKYDDGMKFATVFTNVDDTLSVQQELSSLFQSNGASESEISSISKVDSWPLARTTMLSAGSNDVPSHVIVKKRGIIDVYEQSSSLDYDVVLKASLVCIKVEKTEDVVTSTTWAWQIPLGPGADSDDGKAHSPNVTYGGNPVVFEVEEEEVGDDYSGDATYSNGIITYGEFTALAGEEVEADELWLNLSYDYQDKCVKGTFSNSQDSGAYTQDGILSRNVFVASAKPFTPSADAEVGAKASVDVLSYGTWGVLPKDGPKLDSYCKLSSEIEFKSLDWADREGSTVDCQCAELYKFDQLETDEPNTLSDHVLVRRPDSDGGAELKYVPLSSVGSSLSVDSQAYESSESYQRSIDKLADVLQLYGFNNFDVGDALSSDHMLVRRVDDGGAELKYVSLSSVGRGSGDAISGDTNVVEDYKSIETKEDQVSGEKYHQIYEFDAGCIDGTNTCVIPMDDNHAEGAGIVPNLDAEFLVRRHEGGGCTIISYEKLQLTQEHEPVDSDENPTRSCSLEHAVYSKGPGQDYSVMSLFMFDDGYTQGLLSSQLSSSDGVLIRKNLGNQGYVLTYMDFDSINNFVPDYIGDTNINANSPRKSVNRFTSPNQGLDKGQFVFELYDWDRGGSFQNITIHNDGCTYYWPQDVKTNQSTELDFVLVKHMFSNGNTELRYKQLQVQMPEISDYSGDIQNIYNTLNDYHTEIYNLSVAIDSLSGVYWPQGGDANDCYGSSIGDSWKGCAIDLDTKTLEGGCWFCDSDFHATGTLNGDALRLGNTRMSEAQLSALLALL